MNRFGTRNGSFGRWDQPGFARRAAGLSVSSRAQALFVAADRDVSHAAGKGPADVCQSHPPAEKLPPQFAPFHSPHARPQRHVPQFRRAEREVRRIAMVRAAARDRARARTSTCSSPTIRWPTCSKFCTPSRVSSRATFLARRPGAIGLLRHALLSAAGGEADSCRRRSTQRSLLRAKSARLFSQPRLPRRLSQRTEVESLARRPEAGGAREIGARLHESSAKWPGGCGSTST